MFSKIKNQVRANFEKLIQGQAVILFYVDIDRDKIWDLYLSGFSDPIERQGHNCNCCKSFLRQFSGIVTISGYQKQSIWDMPLEEVDELYRPSIKNIQEYIHSLPVSNRFVNTFAKLGTDQNVDRIKNTTWSHFSLELPKSFVYRGSESVDSLLGNYRDSKTVLKRSLDELTNDACATVLELIAQNSLYRGKEFEANVQKFRDLKHQYTLLPPQAKDNFCWVAASKNSDAICKIRNSAIGTLLIDLSEGMELDQAVTKFERVVAPTNYKRPNSLVTAKMVDEAKNRIVELGLENSLERRYAAVEDISIENLLFVDRSSGMSDIFADMQKDVIVNPKSLSKIEEVTIEDFIDKVIPTAKSVEILVENSHLNNMVSLLTATDKSAPSMFKWNNPFSWSYTGGITDSMKERVKAAGGKVDGVLRFSIQWNEDGKSICDLDAHAYEPDGIHIYFSQYKGYKTPMSGMLDVDMIRPSKVGVENITWSDISKMREGAYTFRIHNYDGGRNSGFAAQIEFDGQIHDFSSNKHLSGVVDIAKVNYSKAKGFELIPLMDSKTSITSKEKWGIKTNQFIKVKNVMLSPNYWGAPVGNKHYVFTLENCVSDEKPRPFFNEFLKEDLTKDRKVFEVLAGKLNVPPSSNQLSGIGFSETQRNHLIVRVEGAFKRNLKINF
jgi:hypothetical protein